ncbi:MAG: PQQ-dependent sugar dehydrogenase [Minwuia sp.]|uniref:PQQ-dependent sugar dehydrogenase n=1 Tax=Minwuia sp. TaxID=2493630 RepID=UPI003A88C15E
MRHLTAVAAAAACWLAALPASAEDFHDTSAGKVSVEKMADGLSYPWSFAFLPDGDVLVTERDNGKLLRITPGTDRRTEVAGVPEVSNAGQGGFFDVVPARDFGTTRELFLTYARPETSSLKRTALAIARLSDDGNSLENFRVIFQLKDATSSNAHFGGRVVEADDGKLFLTVGDRGDAQRAQDPNAHNGKLIRVNRDGSIPSDNPFANGPLLPEIWSMGHRNPQGAALDEKGRIWTVAHGARGGDEINQPQAGLNYGWPIISYGTHYSGGKIGVGTEAPGMEQPKHYWDPSIAPSGMTIYSGKLFPEWQGDIFVGSLKFDLISRLDRDDDRITGEEQLFEGDYNRIRDIREAPDGSIWFLSVGDRSLYRMTPAN